MSSSALPPVVEGDEVWVENAALIRRLYISERKTLKQVKEVMEGQHGFPDFPLCIYETKLRERLNLRKKLKKTDWPAIHQLVLDRGGKDTGVYINGLQIPPKKVWKEIRRSGNQSVRRSQRQLSAGVVVRTPSPSIGSPILFPSSPTLESQIPLLMEAQLTHTNVALQGWISAPGPSHGNISGLSTSQYIGATNALGRATEVLSNIDVLFHRPYLESMPINMFGKTTQLIISNNVRASQNAGAVSGQQPDVDSFKNIMHVVLGVNRAVPSTMGSSHQLEYSSSVPAVNFDSYYFLTRVLYILSNKMTHSIDRSIIEILIIGLQNKLLLQLLLQFLRSDLPTARAAWESSVEFASMTRRMDLLYSLLKAGLEHPDWILADGQTYLAIAASAGRLDIIQGLLGIGLRADNEIKLNLKLMSLPCAILQAIHAGSIACVEALLQGCDVNRTMAEYQDENIGSISNFSLLFSAMGPSGIYLTKYEYPEEFKFVEEKYSLSQNAFRLNLNDEMHSRVLDMFLDHGADVDSRQENFLSWFDGMSPLEKLHSENDVPLQWKLSFLDQSYYWDTKLYERLSPYSLREGTQISRPGICQSAKQGRGFLQSYLDSRAAQHPADRTRLLELILAEQFFIEHRDIDAQVVQGLVDFGVDINLPTMITAPETLCRQLVSIANRLGFTDAASSLLRLLVCQGVVIDQDSTNAAINQDDLGLLPQLADFGADIKKYGDKALCSAACFNNFEAVSWLLQAGVDINASISFKARISPSYTKNAITFTCYTETIIAYIISNRKRSEYWDQASTEMLAYMVHRGAKLRYSPDDLSSYDFLKSYIGWVHISHEAHVETLKLFLDSVACPEDLGTSQESLLASWQPSRYTSQSARHRDPALDAYELLLERGCPIRRHCQLATYISYGGRREVIHKLLDAGADVNAYSQDPLLRIRYPIQAAVATKCKELFDQLLRRGANVDQPAIGYYGRTALQSACELCEGERKMDMIKTLIDMGANVNAPAAESYGMTALQIAACNGYMGTALVLLEHGAEINAPPAKEGGYCALDAAATNGRLDMVKLLLNLAAHSYRRGTTGYAGAIDLAEESGHLAVAELIRDHIKTFGNCIIVDLGDVDLVNAPDDDGGGNIDNWGV
ncbi:hypothetical protein F4802DRAFT_618459 [Xylaria palmicola]|nr:hypothetical protein F4802DRAFT_618459 [Xylaria palmicola]